MLAEDVPDNELSVPSDSEQLEQHSLLAVTSVPMLLSVSESAPEGISAFLDSFLQSQSGGSQPLKNP